MSAGAGARLSAVDRLRELGAVFDLRDVSQLFGWDEVQTRVFCARSNRRGLIRAAGPRSGIYYNLIVDPSGPQRRVGEALRRHSPSAIIIGGSALHAGEWTTQRPQFIEVAVPRNRTTRTCPRFYGARTVFRDSSWYLSVSSRLLADPEQRGLRVLAPEAALADAWVHRDVWKPDPDDVQLPDEMDLDLIAQWLEQLGMSSSDAARHVDQLERMRWGGLPVHKNPQEPEPELDPLDDDEGFSFA